MDRELQDYYEAIIYTTNTPGWELMVQDAISDRTMLNSVPHITDAEHLFTTQGRIRELDAFIAFKDTIRAGYEKLVDEESEKLDERDEPGEAEIV